MKIAIILGGALNRDGELSEYVQNRCLRVISDGQEYDYYIASSRYTLNVPPKVDNNGHIIYENKKICDYLQCLGIPKNKIILESASTDTIGSALFCRNYIQNLFMNQLKFLDIFLVTSDFHMKRSYEVFSWAFSLKPDTLKFNIHKLIADDFGVTSERKTHEMRSLQNFQKEWASVSEMQAAFNKLLNDHDNYSTFQKSRNEHNEILNY